MMVIIWSSIAFKKEVDHQQKIGARDWDHTWLALLVSMQRTKRYGDMASP